MKYDVFISCKSEDYNIGRQVYEFLVNHRDCIFTYLWRIKNFANKGMQIMATLLTKL